MCHHDAHDDEVLLNELLCFASRVGVYPMMCSCCSLILTIPSLLVCVCSPYMRSWVSVAIAFTETKGFEATVLLSEVRSMGNACAHASFAVRVCVSCLIALG